MAVISSIAARSPPELKTESACARYLRCPLRSVRTETYLDDRVLTVRATVENTIEQLVGLRVIEVKKPPPSTGRRASKLPRCLLDGLHFELDSDLRCDAIRARCPPPTRTVQMRGWRSTTYDPKVFQ